MTPASTVDHGDKVPSVGMGSGEGDKPAVTLEELEAGRRGSLGSRLSNESEKPNVASSKLKHSQSTVSEAPVTKKATRAVILEERDFVGPGGDLLQELDLDGDGRITLKEILKHVSKKKNDVDKAEERATKMRRYVVALITVVTIIVALNSICTVAVIENTKETHVVNQQMTDTKGKKVLVASSDMGVKVDGQICPRSESGECLPGLVKTGEARSYASLFDLPFFDSKTLGKLRELTLLLQNRKEVTLTIVGSMKHEGGKSATFYSPSGNKVVVDGTTMTALVVVEGKQHVVSNPKRRLRRLQEGQQWQPQLYEEPDFFTAENGFDVVLDSQTGRHLRRRLNADSDQSGWASLALSISEAVTGYYESSEGRQIQHFASITGKVIISSGSVSTDVDMAILYNKTEPKHSRLSLATGSQAWLTVYGQSMEFESAHGTLQSCEILSSPQAPELITNAASLVESDGVLSAFAETDGADVQITMMVTGFEFDTVIDALKVPDISSCPKGGRRLAAPASNGTGGWEGPKSGGQVEGRRLAAFDMWKIAQATYGSKGWQRAYGDADYSEELPEGWVFVGSCSIEAANGLETAKAKIAKGGGGIGVSFAVFKDAHDLLRRAANGESVASDVQMDSIAAALAGCVAEKLGQPPSFVIGHGLGGAAAVSYFHQQGLNSKTEITTFGAPPTGAGECALSGTRWAHVNDAFASDLLAEASEDHEVANGKIYDDTSPRRRWKTWERRRVSAWTWTDDCERKSSDSFSNVAAVLNFNNDYGYVTR